MSTELHSGLAEELRSEFEVNRSWTYLDVASRAPMARHVAHEMLTHIEECRAHGAHKRLWLERVERVRARLARLLHAHPDEIAFAKNTSDGLGLLAGGVPLEPGDNIVVCSALEHPNNVYAWLPQASKGVDVRSVPDTMGSYDTDALMDAIDERTRILAISSVSFLTGSRADLKTLARRCRVDGTFLLVDAVQSLGTTVMDVEDLAIGGLAAATQKGLLGMYGLGIVYCSRTWAEAMHPRLLTRAGVENGYEHESELGDLGSYVLAPGARRFEVGNHNFAGIFALDAALDLIERTGVERIERHVHSLGSRLMQGVTALGWEVVTPRPTVDRGNIVAFRDRDAIALADELGKRGIRVAARRGLVRASFHMYNDAADVDRLLEALADILQGVPHS